MRISDAKVIVCSPGRNFVTLKITTEDSVYKSGGDVSRKKGSHGATDLSPVCMAAALHFDLSVPNFGIQEYMRHSEGTDRVFPHSYTSAGGMMFPGDKPGLGVEIDGALAAQFPYRRAYLRINRELDGTMHRW
jgi:mannonate dehydratase